MEVDGKTRIAGIPTVRESALYEQMARYIAFAHADVPYRFDLAADLKLTKAQAARHKRLHQHRAWPVLFISHRYRNATAPV